MDRQIGGPDTADVFQGKYGDGEQFKNVKEQSVLLLKPVGGFEDHRQYIKDNQADREDLKAAVVAEGVPNGVEEDIQASLQSVTSIDLIRFHRKLLSPIRSKIFLGFLVVLRGALIKYAPQSDNHQVTVRSNSEIMEILKIVNLFSIY